jgi:hypothetical protein
VQSHILVGHQVCDNISRISLHPIPHRRDHKQMILAAGLNEFMTGALLARFSDTSQEIAHKMTLVYCRTSLGDAPGLFSCIRSRSKSANNFRCTGSGNTLTYSRRAQHAVIGDERLHGVVFVLLFKIRHQRCSSTVQHLGTDSSRFQLQNVLETCERSKVFICTKLECFERISSLLECSGQKSKMNNVRFKLGTKYRNISVGNL